MITHAVGLSLGASSSIESGVAVMELATRKLIYIDKLFSMNDIQLFFENYVSLKNSSFCISLPWDNTMLEGKWRVLSKQYQLIHNNDDAFLNRDNWMQRFSTRGCELFSTLAEQGADICRFEVYLARQKLNLYSNYKERSSADCKFLQSILKQEHGFEELPSNMMPMGELEAIVGILLAEHKIKNETENIFEFKGLTFYFVFRYNSREVNMENKCSKYEELFISTSSEEELEKHIQECEECKTEHESQQKVSSLLDEVKMYYYAKRRKNIARLRAACAIAFLVFSLVSVGGFALTDDDLMDTLKYGDTLSAEDLGFPVDSYGLLMVDE